MTHAYILCCTTTHTIFPIFLTFCCLLHFLILQPQNNPSINLRYTILRSLSTMLSFQTSTTLVYRLHFSTLQPQTILLQFYPFFAIPSYTHSLLSSTLCYTLHSTNPGFSSIGNHQPLHLDLLLRNLL